ncbi:uncharacterized protein J7T54_005484 [Emericellopsis cladophorae]|uniref:N-acetyltransferase domain-containing protein n=1 Tax=Emericellopsis cladophorae TaxID=2686198 RepID=A0A9Q0BG90_9HYPO|nr:uncharacterized protein J7T54_005484 [Emericellopsis cladophorae]KAI6783455.1 hypothetical protein J7T54_005484 [Emericellopsis cladophorae]
MVSTNQVRVLPWESEADALGAFACAAKGFGEQTSDGIWQAMFPGWDTPEGRRRHAAKLGQKWKDTGKDKNGIPHAVFLKAVTTDEDGTERIIGYSIWTQYSGVEGHGVTPPDSAQQLQTAKEKYPDDEREARFCHLVLRALNRQRVEAIWAKAKEKEENPAALVLDICVVDPAFQGRGAAKRMVQCGVEEARRRGDLELMTEGSAMGRHVYTQFGFQQEGPEMDYGMPAEFQDRALPSNIFMRTKPKRKSM